MVHISSWLMLMMGDNIDTGKKNSETSIDADEEVGLEVNAEKSLVTSMHEQIMR
jgi:hypothetical protein